MAQDVFIHFRRPGSEFDKLYQPSWTRFGKLIAGTELSDTLLLGEIDADANDLPAGPPVGGEYIEAACFVFYPAQRKFSPTYILLHTDPDKTVRSKGADFFWQWVHVHGMPETRGAVVELAADRPMSGIQRPPPPPTPQVCCCSSIPQPVPPTATLNSFCAVLRRHSSRASGRRRSRSTRPRTRWSSRGSGMLSSTALLPSACLPPRSSAARVSMHSYSAG